MEMRRKNLREREREYVVFMRVRAPNAIWDPYIRSNFVSTNLLRARISARIRHDGNARSLRIRFMIIL